jgi:hypothetical protein
MNNLSKGALVIKRRFSREFKNQIKVEEEVLRILNKNLNNASKFLYGIS